MLRHALRPSPAVAACILSLGLNAAGVGWGLPSRFHPDEKADVVASMVSERRLVPDSFVNPSLPLLVMAPMVAAQGWLADADLLPESWGDPLLAGRLLSALAGALAVLLLGLAAARAAPEAAVLAPFLLALAPGAVNLGHFATPEPWLVLATSAVLWLCVRHLEGRVPAWAVGLGLGLCASTKYTAAALVVPVALALWLRPRGPRRPADRVAWLAAAAALLAVGAVLAGPPGGRLAASLRLPDVRLLHPESARAFVAAAAGTAIAAGALALVAGLLARGRGRLGALVSPLVRAEIVVAGLAAAFGFLLGTPGALLEPRRFLSDLAFNAQTRHEYKGLVGDATAFLPYLRLLADALTLPVLAAALLGLVLAVTRAGRGRRTGLVIGLAAATPWLLVASSGHTALRFVAPVLPAACWLAADALGAIRERRARLWVSGVVLARVAVSAVLVVRLFFVDSRLLAERWMERNVPPGATVDVITNHDGYVPRVPRGREERRLRTLSREMAPPERFEEAAAAYATDASDWLVLTASFYERFLASPEKRPERARFFGDLLAGRGGFEVAARFRQEGWRRPRADEFLDPEIVVLRRVRASR